MRIFHVTLIVRLLLLSVYPAVTLAAEPDSTNTLQNKNGNLIMIEQGQMKDIMAEPELQRETLSHSILKASTPAASADKVLSANEKRILAYKSRLDAWTAPQGKVKILVTGYSSTVDQCDSDPFTTASGTHVHKGTMACPPQYPFGTKITIDGVGTFVCEDRGGAIKGNHFDMWFTTRSEALQWGKQVVEAEITK